MGFFLKTLGFSGVFKKSLGFSVESVVFYVAFAKLGDNLKIWVDDEKEVIRNFGG